MGAPQLVLPIPRRFTRAEYDRLIELGFFHGERLERIRGSLLHMPPIGPPHATLVSNLAERLLPALLGRAKVRIQQPLSAHDESEPEPDLAVVPLADYSVRHPDCALLVIEVAESSLQFDRDSKGPLYAASGVLEYWIVDIAGRSFEIFTEPEGDRYTRSRRVSAGETVSPSAFPDVTVDPHLIFG
jgi:Uma2 family endonuclease